MRVIFTLFLVTAVASATALQPPKSYVTIPNLRGGSSEVVDGTSEDFGLDVANSIKKFAEPLQTHHHLRGGESHSVEYQPRRLPDVAQLTVMCVPWQGSTAKRHTTISGQPHRLKGVIKTPDTSTVWYKWVYGDGTESSVESKSGLTKYILAPYDHTYTGEEGAPFTAKLVASTDGLSLNNPKSCDYKIQIQENTLDSKINVAIDNGLWFLYQQGTTSPNYRTFNGSPVMVWSYGSYGVYSSPTASAVQAFEINGHKETGNADVDPYVEAVKHGLNWLIHGYYSSTSYPMLQSMNIACQHDDCQNGNNKGIEVRDYGSYYPAYQGGMVMDAIIASGTPNADSGRDFDGNGKNETYRDIIQEMIDQYVWGQYDSTASWPALDEKPAGSGIIGGWRYSWNQAPDNSAAQWAAIGIIPAEQPPWNCNVPQWVKNYNDNWLYFSFLNNFDGNTNWGGFGYTVAGWGYAQTPSGMVQLDFAGAETTDLRWVKSERSLAENWATGRNWLGQNMVYAYYAFAKAMRLAKPEPVVTFSINSFDWYRGSATVMGLAEKIASKLIADHYWDYYGVNLGTAWSVIILKPVLFSEAPIACFDADPNPNYPDRPIRFNPACSGHSEEGKDIDDLVKFEWDFNNDGTFDINKVGPDVVEKSFPCPSLPCTYPVKLRVTDNSDPERTATYVRNIEISVPPHPPIARVLSPYMLSFCPDDALVLDGSASYDPNEGEHEDGCSDCPNDTITAWEWDLDGAPYTYLDKSGEIVDLGTGWDSYFSGPGAYDIGLRVRDNTKKAYPGSGTEDLTDEEFGSVEVYDDCLCDATGTPMCLQVNLTWSDTGADLYYIFRSMTGPNLGFQDIGRTNNTSKIAGSFVMDVKQWYRIMAEKGNDRCTSGPIEVTGPASLCNPTADAGGPYSFCKGEKVLLNASGSTARAGILVAWDWDLDNDGDFDDAHNETVEHIWKDNGEYTIGLRVTSSDSLMLTDNATIIVEIGKDPRCTTNAPPDCTKAVANPSNIWPANHKFVSVVIGGVTDPDGDEVSITVTSIKQDEPVNTQGDGNTCPDANITTTGGAQVRAERSGTNKVPGNGRVYHITFTADDDNGGTCDGEVTVCVPHDQGQRKTCVDGGALYDSTKCP